MRTFDRNKDLSSINSWLDGRGLKTVRSPELPELGWIEPGVGAGFLRGVEGGYFILDSIVTNDMAPKLARHTFLQDLFEAAVLNAEGRKILGFTTEQTIEVRAYAAGFKRVAHCALVHDGDVL